MKFKVLYDQAVSLHLTKSGVFHLTNARVPAEYRLFFYGRSRTLSNLFQNIASFSYADSRRRFLLLARYVPNVAKEEYIWDQCKKYEYWRPPTTDDRPHTGKFQMAI